MASTSTSIFPLTYLGNSVLQSTREDELETIYELLFDYYLDFLRKVVIQFKRVQSFTDIMSEAYSTVVMAIGNGHLILRFISTEKCGDQTFRKHLEKKFTPDELIYFNCYYMEVVIPMGRGGRKCFAYFRRAVDTRRCVPEDALLELDDQLSAWLLHNRHIPRPPLVQYPRWFANYSMSVRVAAVSNGSNVRDNSPDIQFATKSGRTETTQHLYASTKHSSNPFTIK
ncbi:uncharacterized protein DEA37_0002291 [Paragonimus westermani]|uniref:Uncharacterized protein n=1 Tax=Paragonimus westermani TaxID=34504 RepID=A0A5J4NZM6_9TREM|nr:uncharacterized protein DEA37_0002291 [Paragonimus westermani]